MEEVVDLAESNVDSDHGRASLVEQVFAQGAAAIHLDEQPTELPEGLTAGLQKRPSLAAEESSVWTAWSNAGRPTLKRRHRAPSLTLASAWIG
jgi:hypothetical protein